MDWSMELNWQEDFFLFFNITFEDFSFLFKSLNEWMTEIFISNDKKTNIKTMNEHIWNYVLKKCEITENMSYILDSSK